MRYLGKLKKINEDFGMNSMSDLPRDPRVSAADDEANLENPNLELPAKNTHDKLLLQANESPSGHADDGSISIKIVGEGQQASLELDGQEVEMLGRWLEKFKPHVTQPNVTGQEVPDQQQRQINELGGYEGEYSRLQQEDKEDDAFYSQFEEPKKKVTPPPPPKPKTVASGGGRIKMEEEELAALVSGMVEEMLAEMGNPNEAPPPVPKGPPREMDDRDRKYNPMGESQLGDEIHQNAFANRKGMWFLAHEPNQERVFTARDVQKMDEKYGLDVKEGETFKHALMRLQGMIQPVEDLPREQNDLGEIQHGGSTPKGKADPDLRHYGSGEGKTMRSRTMHQDLKAQAGKNLRGTERKEIEMGREEIDELAGPRMANMGDPNRAASDAPRSPIQTRQNNRGQNYDPLVSSKELNSWIEDQIHQGKEPAEVAQWMLHNAGEKGWPFKTNWPFATALNVVRQRTNNMGGRGGSNTIELHRAEKLPGQSDSDWIQNKSRKGLVGGGPGFAESWAAYNKKHGKG
jgi:hypothetical protein